MSDNITDLIITEVNRLNIDYEFTIDKDDILIEIEVALEVTGSFRKKTHDAPEENEEIEFTGHVNSMSLKVWDVEKEEHVEILNKEYFEAKDFPELKKIITEKIDEDYHNILSDYNDNL